MSAISKNSLKVTKNSASAIKPLAKIDDITYLYFSPHQCIREVSRMRNYIIALAVIMLLLFGCATQQQPTGVSTTGAGGALGSATPNNTQAQPTTGALVADNAQGAPSSAPDTSPASAPQAGAPAVSATAPAPVVINVKARDWAFDPATITVKKGVPVTIVVTSEDVAHGFAILDFNVNLHVDAGQTAQVTFTPDKAGTFTFFCSVFCGQGHKAMKGTLVVEE
jgi:cytochrome c oxidase subunit 2